MKLIDFLLKKHKEEIVAPIPDKPKSDIVDCDVNNNENTENPEVILDKLFSSKHFYAIKNIKDDSYYIEKINKDKYGLIYIDKQEANMYADELKNNLRFNKNLIVSKIEIEDIFNYIENIASTHNTKGIVINYPYNWIIYNLIK